MSDKKRQVETSDPFSQYISQRLREHTLPPDDACWEEIEARMQPSRRFPLWRIGAVAGVAVAVVLAFLLFIHIPSEIVQHEMVQRNIEKKKAVPVVDATPVQQPLVAVKTVRKDTVLVAAKAEETVADIPTDTIPDVPQQEQEKAPAYTDKSDRGYQSNSYTDNLPKRRRQSPSNWLVAASFGTGQSVTLGPRSGEELVYDNDNPPLGEEVENGNLPGWDPSFNNSLIDNYSDVSYQLPLSFGLTVRKNLNKYVAVESGIVYTYLATYYKERRKEAYYEAKQGMHYLGIPLSIVGYVYNSPSWNVYLSGGVMGEKGIQAVTTFDKYVENDKKTSKERSSVSGMQWSLNASLGVSYRLFKEWSIYAEPRVSYFFDSDQPLSIRTDKPVTFGIGGGIRYEF